MIVVKLMGGLGNQMFQYAAARALALKNRCELKLDLTFLNKDVVSESYIKREFELNRFNFVPVIASNDEVYSFEKWEQGNLWIKLNSILPFIRNKKIFRELHHNFIDKFNYISDNTLLIGYWQSEKYFQDIRSTLLDDFTFKYSVSGKNEDLLKRIMSVNSVSIHVRRGDYITNASAKKFHGTCEPEYYSHAISIIRSKMDSIELFIFSDEIEWCRNNLKFDLPLTFVENKSSLRHYEDLRLMSACKHNVIANSSFSWWGAWLNRNLSKIVIAPANWFFDQTINASDLIPAAWVRI